MEECEWSPSQKDLITIGKSGGMSASNKKNKTNRVLTESEMVSLEECIL